MSLGQELVGRNLETATSDEVRPALDEEQSHDPPAEPPSQNDREALLLQRGLIGPAREFFIGRVDGEFVHTQSPPKSCLSVCRDQIKAVIGIIAYFFWYAGTLYYYYYQVVYYYHHYDSFDRLLPCKLFEGFVQFAFGSLYLLIWLIPIRLACYKFTLGVEDNVRDQEVFDDGLPPRVRLVVHCCVFLCDPRSCSPFPRVPRRNQNLGWDVFFQLILIMCWILKVLCVIALAVFVQLRLRIFVAIVHNFSVEVCMAWEDNKFMYRPFQPILIIINFLYCDVCLSSFVTHVIATYKQRNSLPLYRRRHEDPALPLTDVSYFGQNFKFKVLAVLIIPLIVYTISYTILILAITEKDIEQYEERQQWCFSFIIMSIVYMFVCWLYIPLIIMLKENLNSHRLKLRQILVGSELAIEGELYEVKKQVAAAMDSCKSNLEVQFIMNAFAIIMFVVLQWGGKMYRHGWAFTFFPLLYLSTAATLSSMLVIAQYNAYILKIASDIRGWRVEMANRVEGLSFDLFGRAISTGDFAKMAITALSAIMSGVVKQYEDTKT